MANTIKFKRGSGSDPGTSDLSVGEIAIRTDTAKIFTKNDGGSVVEISGGVEDGDITTSKIADDAVTFAKIQNVSATDRLLGRDSSGAGIIEEIAPSAVRTMLGLAASATTDTTNASNISSGTLAAARVATLNQDTTGNAATATALETARTIAGVSFDGTSNISLNNNAITNGAGYITATLTNEQVQDIVGSMLTGNTETGITVTYQDGDGTIDFVVGTLNQDTTGNAATATALETARTIAGVSFDGTGNISLNNNAITNGAGYITDLVNDTSPQLGGDLASNSNDILMADDDIIKVGTGSDLQIDHDSGTGQNIIQASAITRFRTNSVFSFQNNDGSEAILKGTPDGSVEAYYNGVKTFETDSTGVNVLGNSGNGTLDIFPTGSAVYSILNFHNTQGGTAYNAQIIAASGQSIFVGSGNTGEVTLRTGNSDNKVRCLHNGSVELYHDTSKKAETVSGGFTVTGTCTATAFSGDGSSLTGISAGATGGGSDEIFYENGQNVTTDYTITNGKNAMSAGPITIDSGVTVTVGAGETLTIV